jgi:predicted CXXCH cytochrome family protein
VRHSDQAGLSLGVGNLHGVLNMPTLLLDTRFSQARAASYATGSLSHLRVSRLAFAMLLLGLFTLAQPGVVWAGGPGGDLQAGQTCKVCHATPGLTMQLASGEMLAVTVNVSTFTQSVHGSILQCTACHADIASYPHPARQVARSSVRDIPFLMRSYASCGSCHRAEYEQYLGSAHAQALNAGESDSAVCTDCHGTHDISQAKPIEVGLALGPSVYSCGSCHQVEFELYKNSVHGKALLQDGDVNVPACVDCHGAHDIHQAKNSTAFRSQSVALCASCHANSKLMAKYGRSSQLLTAYVADFHGMSAMLSTASNGPSTAQALCYDCHSAHAIQSTVSVNGLRVQENLLKTCQQCHPDASANFLTARVGHTNPIPADSALVFGTREFYKNLIILVVLLLVVYIVLEFARVVLNTLQGRSHSHE